MSSFLRATGLLLVVLLGPVAGNALHPLAHAMEASSTGDRSHDEAPASAKVSHVCDVCAVHLHATTPVPMRLPVVVAVIEPPPVGRHDAAPVMARLRATPRGPPVETFVG